MQKLGLHTDILPGLHDLLTRDHHLGDADDMSVEEARNRAKACRLACEIADGVYQTLLSARVFDCRAIPTEFAEDSGESFLKEAANGFAPALQLPFDSCYFEFDHEEAVLASVSPHRDCSILLWQTCGWGAGLEYEWYSFLDFPFLGLPLEAAADGVAWSLCPYGGSNPARELGLARAANLMIGVLSLMNEKLVLDHVTQDNNPYVNAKRTKRGKPPISATTHVITVSVPAVRHKVSRSIREVTHEPPCLHWRRGHWRTMHRGSEFEDRVWVNRCLVGDPDRGYVVPSYKLLPHRLPMLLGSSSVN